MWIDEEREGRGIQQLTEVIWGSQLYLMFFPLFLHLTHSSLGGCWERGLSNIWHWGSEVANTDWCKHTYTYIHRHTDTHIKPWWLISIKSLLLTGLCLGAGFLSAGFLAPSETFLTVKGTPYLLAGLVIFCAGLRGMEAGAGRLASPKSYTNKNIVCISMFYCTFLILMMAEMHWKCQTCMFNQMVANVQSAFNCMDIFLVSKYQTLGV